MFDDLIGNNTVYMNQVGLFHKLFHVSDPDVQNTRIYIFNERKIYCPCFRVRGGQSVQNQF